MTTQSQTGSATIDQLIINSPYEEPREHWRYDRETRLFTREPERRKAGYIRASEKSRSFDDPGIFTELPLVNQIRPRVKAWREADYSGASGITKRLLQHWRDTEQRDSNRRFFFCQLEAIETLMWLTEAPASERVGIDVPGDGGPFARLCCKMATGSGKTILMAMLIAWQVLNKVTYPQDKRFSKNILAGCAGPDGEEPIAGAGSRHAGQLLHGVSDGSARPRRQTPAGTDLPRAHSQLAQAGLGE